MTNTLTPEQLLLEAAADAQIAYWDALNALEKALGFDLENVDDLSGYSIEELKAEHESLKQEVVAEQSDPIERMYAEAFAPESAEIGKSVNWKPLGDREIAMILHALRSVQQNKVDDLPDACDHEACDHFDGLTQLTVDEIDALCESINFDRLAILEDSVEPQSVIVTVSGGVAEVAVKPQGVTVDIIDFDNLKETLHSSDPSERIVLNPIEADFLKVTDPAFWQQIETKTDFEAHTLEVGPKKNETSSRLQNEKHGDVVSFDVTLPDLQLIIQIVRRFDLLVLAAGVKPIDVVSAQMDLCAVHASGCPLNLAGLLAAKDEDLMHDVSGIGSFLDRATGKIDPAVFNPRFRATTA